MDFRIAFFDHQLDASLFPSYQGSHRSVTAGLFKAENNNTLQVIIQKKP